MSQSLIVRKNKKGQVSDAVTWIVATVAIVVIMLFFIFAASLFAETKGIKKYKASLFSTGDDLGDDLFLKKSLFSYVTQSKDDAKRKLLVDLEKKDAEKKLDASLSETKRLVQLRYDLK